MQDHYETGKKLILDAAGAQLRMMGSAREIMFANHKGGSEIFEVALRRIGEGDLAKRFVNPEPRVEDYVNRGDSKAGILYAVISFLERGERDFALEIETLQRRRLYLGGVGYFDQHFTFAPTVEKRGLEPIKELVRKGVLERGLDGSRKHRRLQKSVSKSLKGGEFDDRGYQLGALSFGESMHAVYICMALGNREHASRVIQEVRNTHYGINAFPHRSLDEESDFLRADVLMGAGLIQGPREKARKLFSRASRNDDLCIPSLAFVLDQLDMEDELNVVREKIALEPHQPKTEITRESHGTLIFGYDSFHNAKLLGSGLALTGLEKNKPNCYLTTTNYW